MKAGSRQGGPGKGWKGSEMNGGGFLWALMNIVGPLLLVIVLAWVLMRNRKKSSPADIARTEQATHDLYREEEAARRREDENVP